MKTSVEGVRVSWVLVEGMYLCHSLSFPLFDHFLSLQLGTFFGLFEQEILVLLAQTHVLRVWETHGSLLKASIYVILFHFLFFDHFLSLQLGAFFGLFEQKILVLLAQTHLLRV